MDQTTRPETFHKLWPRGVQSYGLNMGLLDRRQTCLLAGVPLPGIGRAASLESPKLDRLFNKRSVVL